MKTKLFTTKKPVTKDEVDNTRCFHRVCDICRNETFTKKMTLWHQNTWEELSQMPATEIKDGIYLFASFDFPVELEDVGTLRSWANPSVLLDRNKILSLRALQKKLEEKSPGSTQRPPTVNPRPLGTPIFKSSLTFDRKTGLLTTTLFHDVPDASTASAVRVNLDKSFGYKEDQRNFLASFTAKSPKTEEIKSEEIITPPEPGENRIFDLEDNESVGKDSKIWEIAIWPQLVEAMKANRAEKFTICYPVHVELIGKFEGVPLNEEGVSIVPHEETAELTIDYRTMIQMEKLREASSSEQ